MKYEKPEWEIIEFMISDVIRTSTTDGGTIKDPIDPEEGDTPFVPGTVSF